VSAIGVKRGGSERLLSLYPHHISQIYSSAFRTSSWITYAEKHTQPLPNHFNSCTFYTYALMHTCAQLHPAWKPLPGAACMHTHTHSHATTQMHAQAPTQPTKQQLQPESLGRQGSLAHIIHLRAHRTCIRRQSQAHAHAPHTHTQTHSTCKMP